MKPMLYPKSTLMKKACQRAVCQLLQRGKALRLAALGLMMSFCSYGQVPSVSMSFPQFNSSYISGSELVIQASATTPAGTTVTKVEFFFDASFSGTYTKIGEDLTAPYSIAWTVPSVPTVRSYQIRAVVTNSAGVSAIQGGSGYNGISVYAPSYNSTRNWYVNAAASASNTAGTLEAPFNTIQKAADRVAPGDTVFVMNGTYTSTGINIVGIQRTGLPGKPIVFMPYGADKPVLQLGNNNFNGFNILPAAAFIKIQGFEVIGNNASISLTQARAQPGACEGTSPTATPTARFNGNGISVSGRNGGSLRPHHVVIASNNVHDCAGGGISSIEADYITIEDNITARTSWYTVYGTSGISIFNSWNYDNSTDVKMIIRRNRSFGNILNIAWNIGGTGTNCKFYDGNGIILDNNRSIDPNRPTVVKNPLGDFTGKFLIENNVCYQNGGRGINVNFSDNALVINNTTYRNGQSDGPFGIGIDNELIIQGSVGSRVYNNIFYGKSGESPMYIAGTSDLMQNNNLTFSDFINGNFTDNQNITGQDPLFVDAANADFRLQSSSPAVNAGSATMGQFAEKDLLGISRPQGAGVDIGAYELEGTPIVITRHPAQTASACVGSEVSFSVQVDGAVKSYQWYKDGAALSGVPSATTSTLTLSGVTQAQQGSYWVVVTGFNQLTSEASALTVNATPVVTLTAGRDLDCTHPTVTLTASPDAPGSYSFSGPAGTLSSVGNTAIASQPGVYSVLYIDANGCQASTSETTVSFVNNLTAPTLLTQSGQLYPEGKASVTVPQYSGNVVLIGAGCEGTLLWTGPGGTSGTGTTILVATNQTGTWQYTATCQVGTCTSPAATATVTVVSAPLKLETPLYDCNAGKITLRTSGGNGQPIEFHIASVTKGWELATTYTLDQKQVEKGKKMKIEVRQRQMSGHGWDKTDGEFTPYPCASNARKAVAENGESVSLEITLLGNPVNGQEIRAEVRGATNQVLLVELINLQGRVLRQQRFEAAGSTEQVRIEIGSVPGIYLLRASTPTGSRVVKVLKE